MEASDFKRKVEDAMKLLSGNDGSSANSGVGFFIGDMEELFEEWQREYHECSM
ncbi:MAG: hypothetical protein Q8M94_22600 [Ignavibacteria bacterium]|nr:hypothetical protein [Ignavibacteria bacterium]